MRLLLDALQQCGATLLCEEVPADLCTSSAPADNLTRVRAALTAGSQAPERLTLSTDDDSLCIMRFRDPHHMGEYFATMDCDDVDVWINPDCKEMDNWLALAGRPRAGSGMPQVTPRLTQLFVMGVGLHFTPLNIATLVAWLNIPVHPIGRRFRYHLADTIAHEGGYRNAKCREMVERYIAGEYEYIRDYNLTEEQVRYERRRKAGLRRELADIFLPTPDVQSSIATERVRTFAARLSSWARRRAHHIATGEINEDNKLWYEQLIAVADMSDALAILLDTVETETIDPTLLDSWVSTIYAPADFTHAIAEAHCRHLIDSPERLVSSADYTVWMNCQALDPEATDCDFLYPSERAALQARGIIHPVAPEVEAEVRRAAMLRPVTHTRRRLVLAYAERRSGEMTPKHPLVIQLEQLCTNIEAITTTPCVPDEYCELTQPVHNGTAALHPNRATDSSDSADADDQKHRGGITFKDAGDIVWEDHLSPTNIGVLAEHPLDYLMGTVLGIGADPQAEISDIKLTKGNVAHAVIEAIFAPRGEARCTTAAEGRQRVEEEYESIYAQTIEAKGAILQLPEHLFEEKRLHEQLRHCLDRLCLILKANELSVTGCERYVEGYFDLGLPEPEDEDEENAEAASTEQAMGAPKRDMLGYIDMTLEDAAGHPVVIDFKWTTSRRYYPNLLTENRSVQLEMYRRLLGASESKAVSRVAYFLMPAGVLYSLDTFAGAGCYTLEPANRDDIAAQLFRSARYRLKQLKEGFVEIGDGWPIEDLAYGRDTAAQQLFPLHEGEDGGKEANRFSDFALFR